MSFPKLLKFNLLKSALMVLFAVSMFFAGGGKAEAASASWVPPLGHPGTFQVWTDKDTYAPGETITLTAAGTVYSGEFIVIGDYLGYFCTGYGACSGTQNIVAQATPGTQTISLTGCTYGYVICAYSSVSITVSAPAPCYPWGVYVPSGSSIPYYNASSVVSPATCTGGSYLCTNGILSPNPATTPAIQSCTVTYPPATASISQSSASTVSGTPFTYSWGSTNTTSCTPYDIYPDGGVHNLGVSSATNGGPASVAFSTVGTYRLGNSCVPIAGGANVNAPEITHTVTASCTNSTVYYACSSYAGSYGIPANYTVGTASFNQNSCTGLSYNGSACSAPAAPTASLTASPNPVAYGARSTLTWSSSNSTSCTAGGPWSNSGTLSGSGLTNALTSNTTFTFQCTGPGGTSPLQSVTVTVGAPPVPTATLSASPTSIPYNTASTLTWSSTNATGCTATGGTFAGAKAISGSVSTGNLTANQTYTLYCTGAGGNSSTQSTTVTVGSPPAAPTASLTVNGSHSVTLNVGDSNTKTWNSTGGTSWSSIYSFNNGTCANAGTSGAWVANTSSGTSAGVAVATNAGCTATIIYTVTNSVGVSTSDTIYVTTAVPIPTPVSVSVSSATIHAGDKVAVTWNILNPNDTCHIEAISDASYNRSANSAATLEVDNLNKIFNSFATPYVVTPPLTSITDANDPYGSARSLKTAIQATSTASATRAKGQKTVTLNYPTAFNVYCGALHLDPAAPYYKIDGVTPMTSPKKKIRINVTRNIEG